MMRLLFSGIPARGWAFLVVLAAALFAAPFFVNDYLLTVLILIFYFAYTGQAWNILTGFTGYLSLGHAIYVGLGAYTTAALYVHFGVGPWVGLPVAIAVSAACGAIIGFLAFRFGVGGVYFAILTIAFCEFARIGFDHFRWVGGSGGLFLPVAQYKQNDFWNLRGNPTMFYYIILIAAIAALAFCRILLRSRIGYYWQAIREDEQAALALGINTFRYKMIAVVISAAMTSFAGVFFAFYYNNLFPEQVFHISRSIELILGPIIGGIGTLIGPVIGAFLLTGLSEGLHEVLAALGIDAPGAKQVFYGAALLFVVVLMPHGIWPPLAKLLGLDKRSSAPRSGKGEAP
jgi:branched-chain amino acid transport system permease protein